MESSMNKELNIWAIKTSSNLIELRMVRGPVKVIKSIAKKKGTRREIGDYTSIGVRRWEDVPATFTLKQVSIIGGKSMGFISVYMFNKHFPGMEVSMDDVVKLKPAYARTALSLAWRRANLKVGMADDD